MTQLQWRLWRLVAVTVALLRPLQLLPRHWRHPLLQLPRRHPLHQCSCCPPSLVRLHQQLRLLLLLTLQARHRQQRLRQRRSPPWLAQRQQRQRQPLLALRPQPLLAAAAV